MSITTSALVGASYGSEMPVNSFTMPARAFAYSPFLSRCSQTSIEVMACTRMRSASNGSIISRTAFACRCIRSDGRADRDPAILRDFRSHIPDAADVDVAMLLRESQFARQVFAHQIAVEQCDRTPTHLEEFRDQSVGDRGLTRSRKPCEENRDSLLVPGRVAAAQFLHDFRVGKPRRNVAAFVEPVAQFRAEATSSTLAPGGTSSAET